MSSISHQEYKDLMAKLQKATVKGSLIETLNKTVREDIKEYNYTDNYPGSWGYREGKEVDEALTADDDQYDKNQQDMEALHQVAQQASDYTDAVQQLEDNHGVDPKLASEIAAQYHSKVKEGLNPDPLQPTGPSLPENSGNGYSSLTPDERKQLKEYIESVKTIKQEIAKLVSKAGKKVKEGKIGGNRTGLTMPVGNYE